MRICAHPREFLQRLLRRPAGPAATVGVPADRVVELAAELGPALALLDETQAQAAALRGAAAVEADSIRRDAKLRVAG